MKKMNEARDLLASLVPLDTTIIVSVSTGAYVSSGERYTSDQYTVSAIVGNDCTQTYNENIVAVLMNGLRKLVRCSGFMNPI